MKRNILKVIPLILLLGLGAAASFVATVDHCEENHAYDRNNSNRNNSNRNNSNSDGKIHDEIICKKPAIYLYPTEDDSLITVKLDIDGYYKTLDPVFNVKNGWQVIADTDGTIHYDGKDYEYLFWEGKLNMDYDFNEGFCVQGENTEEFLEESLKTLGLNQKEIDDFIEYWLPKMESNNYNVIYFDTNNYTNYAQMNISPRPATKIRVLMCWYGSDEPVEISEQKLVTTERQGFTVVEWGGAEVK